MDPAQEQGHSAHHSNAMLINMNSDETLDVLQNKREFMISDMLIPEFEANNRYSHLITFCPFKTSFCEEKNETVITQVKLHLNQVD